MSEPVLDQNPASDGDKIEGILAQTRVDVGSEDTARIAEVLRQRFTDAGIVVTDSQLADFAKDVSSSE